MKHFLRTIFGISKLFLEWDKNNNSGGMGQENGGRPVSWYSHMLVLEKAYKKDTGHGVEYTKPDYTP